MKKEGKIQKRRLRRKKRKNLKSTTNNNNNNKHITTITNIILANIVFIINTHKKIKIRKRWDKTHHNLKS